MPEFAQIRPVWLASYPRSGNTFLRILLQNFFRTPTYSVYRVEGQEFPDPSAEALEEAPYLPRDWEERVCAAPEARLTLIKTHDAPHDDGPAIYLVRDGRAAIDSYYHYHQKFAFEKPSLTEVIAGACQFGSWSDHYAAWQPRRRPNTLFLRYEQLVTNPSEVIPKLAEFLHVTPTDGRVPSFGELRARFPAFFRRGRNDDFEGEWTAGQIALFHACHSTTMQELGYSSGAAAAGMDTTVELARSASRLHRLYLEQLSRLGAAAASQQRLADQLSQASRQIQELNAEVADLRGTLNSLRRRSWVRLGRVLGILQFKRNGAGKAPIDGRETTPPKTASGRNRPPASP